MAVAAKPKARRREARHAFGRRAERIAERFYLARGHVLAARNLRLGALEVDLLLRAPDGEHTMVEVRARRLRNLAEAVDWITLSPNKVQHLERARQALTQRLGEQHVRLDIIFLFESPCGCRRALWRYATT